VQKIKENAGFLHFHSICKSQGKKLKKGVMAHKANLQDMS
jgi:hypothetical protein